MSYMRHQGEADRVTGSVITLPRPAWTINPHCRTVDYCGISVEVWGEYLPAETTARRDFTVEAAVVGGVDIAPMLTNKQVEDLAALAGWRKE